MGGCASVEKVAGFIVARVRGEPTADLLRETQAKVVSLVGDDGVGRVLYDASQMQAPPVDVPWAQRALDASLGDIRLRRAIVVPDCKLAFLARLAFGDGDYRVFYDDAIAALQWLDAPVAPAARP
jgi:hypothetical protein